jgi:hypothetical protein
VEPCKYACYKPVDTLAGLINDLRSSIATYEVLHLLGSTQALITDLQNPQTDLDPYFTDRRYRQQYRNPPPIPPFRPPLKPNLHSGIFWLQPVLSYQY